MVAAMAMMGVRGRIRGRMRGRVKGRSFICALERGGWLMLGGWLVSGDGR